MLNFTNDLLDELDSKFNKGSKSSEKIHIRIQQRNGKKSITIIENLASDLGIKKISKSLRKSLNCSSAIKDTWCQETETDKKIIQLSGDHRVAIKDFLVNSGISEKEDIKIHGF